MTHATTSTSRKNPDLDTQDATANFLESGLERAQSRLYRFEEMHEKFEDLIMIIRLRNDKRREKN